MVDNTDAETATVGTWSSSTSTAGFLGSNYAVHAAGTGSALFQWQPQVAQAGTYEVYARWTSHANRATDATYVVHHTAGATAVTVNQQQGGGAWQLLGTFDLAAGSALIELSDQANGYVIADAVQISPEEAPPNTATWSLPVATAGAYDVYARWTAHPNRATNASYTVTHAGGTTPVTVNQQQGMGAWNLLGNFTFDAGTAVIELTDVADGYVIADAVELVPAGAAPNRVVWTPALSAGGDYEVYARWTAHANRATDATYTIHHAGGETAVVVNQQQDAGQWNLLGTFTLNASGSDVELTDQANGIVVADTVRFVPVGGGTGGGTSVYFVHADHLGTPKRITDASGTVTWAVDFEPFGNVLETVTSISNNLRYPGQYFDQETGLHYNYFRDYDPSIGRYTQSDPFGLDGGVNTYLYVDANPLRFTDRFGLIGSSAAAGLEGLFGRSQNNLLQCADDNGCAELLRRMRQILMRLSILQGLSRSPSKLREIIQLKREYNDILADYQAKGCELAHEPAPRGPFPSSDLGPTPVPPKPDRSERSGGGGAPLIPFIPGGGNCRLDPRCFVPLI